MYTINKTIFKHAGKVIGIFEYLDKKNKWIKPKHTFGNETELLNDESLNDFIEQYSPEEICLLVKDRKNELHQIDFALSDFEE